jgi:hypothetical protein
MMDLEILFFHFVVLQKNIGFCYNLSKLAVKHGNKKVNLYFPTGEVYARYGKKGEAGAWLEMRLIGPIENTGKWSKITGGMNPKATTIRNIEIMDTGAKFTN